MIGIFNGLRDISLASIFFRVILSVGIGGLLGVERGRKRRAAGFRTYMLVSVGSMLVMLTNQYVCENFGMTDPVRMGAQVISGIGFLGAGTIMITHRNRIKGITTAAGLWTAACCGLAVGIGFYEGALITGAAILFIMTVMGKIDYYIGKYATSMDIYLEFSSEVPFSEFLEYIKMNHLDVIDIQVQKNQLAQNAQFCAVLCLENHRGGNHAEIAAMLSEAPGVQFVEEL